MKWILGLVTGGNPLLLAIVAGVLMSIGAAGGWKVATWRAAGQVAAAERELSDYQAQASRVIIARLEENARLTAEDQRAVVEISNAFQEGKRETAKTFRPVLEELAALRAAADVWRLRDAAATAAGPGAIEDAGASRRRADACEERLRGARAAFGEVAAAAEEVARAGEDAGIQFRQLTGAMDYIRRVCERPP